MFPDDNASLSDALAENNEEDSHPHDSLVCLHAGKEPRFHSKFEQSDAMGKHVWLRDQQGSEKIKLLSIVQPFQGQFRDVEEGQSHAIPLQRPCHGRAGLARRDNPSHLRWSFASLAMRLAS